MSESKTHPPTHPKPKNKSKQWNAIEEEEACARPQVWFFSFLGGARRFCFLWILSFARAVCWRVLSVWVAYVALSARPFIGIFRYRSVCLSSALPLLCLARLALACSSGPANSFRLDVVVLDPLYISQHSHFCTLVCSVFPSLSLASALSLPLPIPFLLFAPSPTLDMWWHKYEYSLALISSLSSSVPPVFRSSRFPAGA